MCGLAGIVGQPEDDPARVEQVRRMTHLANAAWVFSGGRHHRVTEFLLFQFVSAISFGVGLAAGPQLIAWFGISTHPAQASLVVTSALVNFVIRKFVVFQR